MYFEQISPNGEQVLVDYERLRRIAAEAARLLDAGRLNKHDAVTVLYFVRDLLADSRRGRIDAAEEDLCKWFGAESERERELVGRLWWRSVWSYKRQRRTDGTERQFKAWLAGVKKEFESRRWIDADLGPAGTPVFIAMCRRTFGAAVGRRMQAIYRERMKARAGRVAKKKVKARRLADVDRTLASFNSEGGIVGNN